MITAADYVTLARFTDLTVGGQYTASVDVKLAADAPLVALTAEGAQSPRAARTGGWERLTVTFVASADTRVRIAPQTDAYGAVLVDGLLVVAGIQDRAFFDGRSGKDAYWEGMEDSSTSILIDRSIQVTPVYGQGQPHIQLSLDEVIPGVAWFAVHRLADGRDDIVPGMHHVNSSGGFVGRDWYAPPGVPIHYKAEMFDANGVSLGFTTPSPARLDFDDDEAWLSSPSNPWLAVRVTLTSDAAARLTEEYTGAVHQVGARRILIASAGTGLSDLNMDFYTDTVDQFRMALRVFREDSGAIVIRTPPPIEVPRTLYMWSPKPAWMEWNRAAGFEEYDWENRGSEISPPTAQVVVAVLTHRRYYNMYPTGRAFAEAYATYRDALLNPPELVERVERLIDHRTYFDAYPTGRELLAAYPTWRDARRNPPPAQT